MTRGRANLLLLAAGAMWGMGFVAQSTAMQNVGPLLFIGLRFGAATVAMLPFAIVEGSRGPPLSWRDWRAFGIIGVVLYVGLVAQQFGIMHTTVTNSGFLTGLYVVMVPLLGILLFRNWPHPAVWPAALAALTGIWLLSGGVLSRLTVGDWLTVFCALCWAMQLILIARHGTHTGRPVTLAVTQFAVSAALGLAVAGVFEPWDFGGIRRAMPEILYAGVFSGGLAFTLQTVGQRYTTAPQAAIFLSSESVFAALFGAIFLGERLPAIGWAGCALIFSAILIVELVPPLLARRAAATPTA